MNRTEGILRTMSIFLTMSLLMAQPTSHVFAADTEVEDVDQFEETETPQTEEKSSALGEMEQKVMTGAPVIDDPEAEAKQAKKDAAAAENQLAEAQKRLNEMKAYKATLAKKTRQEVAEAEKRRQKAIKEKQAVDSQRRKIEQEVAEIQRTQKKLEAIEKAARLKAEKAKAALAAAKERRAQKRKSTTKAVPQKNKRKSLEPSKKMTAQQARI